MTTRAPKIGKVYLIGGGPGDPGLLTRRGADLLARAQAIVYDYLASPRLLNLVSEEAELYYVGKQGGDHTLSQEGINELIIDLARQGKDVARLKGGDPFIFGRGGEEAEELVQAGVPFEIVPGVTSAVAAPAYAGIPVTHRAHNASVTFATGHEDPTKPESKLNWPALAQTGGTLVLLMGVKKLAANSKALMDGGMDPATPAALVRWGTTAKQRTLVSTIGLIADDAQAAGFGAPSVLVVGGVVELAGKLAWLDNRPLWGLKILITRTRSGAGRLADLLEDLGAEPLVFPTIAVTEPTDPRPLAQAIESLDQYDWLLFTSANGVQKFFAALGKSGRDSRALAGLKICSIGPATSAALTEFGLTADLAPTEYRAEGMIEALADEAAAGKRFLLPRAEEARDILPESLIKAGGSVTVAPAYKTVAPPAGTIDQLKDLLSAGEVDVALFTASSTVKNLAQMLVDQSLAQALQNVVVGSIGPITSQTARDLGLTVDFEAEQYTLPGLIEALVAWKANRKEK